MTETKCSARRFHGGRSAVSRQFRFDIDNVLARLDGVRPTRGGWMARCPAHTDRTPSLSIRIGGDGRVLLHCFAGCSYEKIRRALGLPVAEVATAEADKP